MTACRCLAPQTLDARQWRDAWAGQTVFVLASGPSLSFDEIGLVHRYALATASPVIAVNTSFMRAKWADVLFFSHKSWWLTYRTAVKRTFEGMVASTANVLETRTVPFANGRLPEYGDTGANAVGLAIYMGARRVIVLGFDGRDDSNGLRHWHAPHPAAVLAGRSHAPVDFGFYHLCADAQVAGVEIVNVSPRSEHTGFIRAPLQEYLNDPPPLPVVPAQPSLARQLRERQPPATRGRDPQVLAWQGRWADKTVFVLASGPSLTEADVAAVRAYAGLHDCPVAVTNTTYRIAPWADLLFFYDRQWWRVHEAEALSTFAGQMVTMSGMSHPRVLSMFGQRFDAYKNSGGGAINFAIFAGAKRVVLLGLDGQYASDGRRHWHEQDPRLGNAASLPRFVTYFPALAQEAKRQGVQILNASRQTALTCFPRAALEHILTTDFPEE